jgi:hypothetical protein
MIIETTRREMMSKWIKVKDRLPDGDVEVFAFRPDATFDPVRITRFKGDHFSSLYEITHWMPLPTAPETDDE